MKSEYLSNLSPQQKIAATYGITPGQRRPHRPLLIDAGPGTGKTRTLVTRITHLVVNGADPARILVVAFGHEAADQIKRRVVASVRAATGQDVELPWAGTFHQIGAALIRPFAEKVGLTSEFGFLSPDDGCDLMQLCLDRVPTKRQLPKVRDCLGTYTKFVNAGSKPLSGLLSKLQPVFTAYNRAKLDRNLADYDDLLRLWLALFADDEARRSFRGKFDCIVIDEFQDISRLQAEILGEIAPIGRGLTGAGDEAQSIYSFRGAAVAVIRRFHRSFVPHAKVVRLEENYRSTQPILDAAQAVLSHANLRSKRALRSCKASTRKPRLIVTVDDRQQARTVAEEIQRSHHAGTALSDMVVLTRHMAGVHLLEAELDRVAIKNVKTGGRSSSGCKAARDVLSILRFCERPDLDLAAMRAVQLVRSVGPTSAHHLFKAINGNLNSAHLQSLTVPRLDSQAWKRFAKLIAPTSNQRDSWPRQFEKVRAWYERRGKLSKEDLGHLDHLSDLAKAISSRRLFLEAVSLGQVSPRSGKTTDAIEISTFHGSKGREWQRVWIVNAVDGQTPSSQATTARAIEEEARLLQVAMTRAESRLAVVVPRTLTALPHTPGRAASRTRFISKGDLNRYYKVEDLSGRAWRPARLERQKK